MATSIPSSTTRPTHTSAPPQSSSSSVWTMPQHPAPSTTTTTTTVVPFSTTTAVTSSSDTQFDSNSGYIYIVLILALLAALFLFGRAAFARRKERLRALKDPDYESGPPTYNRHVQDLQVVEGLAVPETALTRGEQYYILTPRTTRHSVSGHSNRRHRSQVRRPVVVVSVDHGDSSRTMVVGTTSTTISATSSSSSSSSTDPTLPTYDDVVQNQRPVSTQVVARPARSSSLSLPTLPDPPTYVATLAPTREEV